MQARRIAERSDQTSAEVSSDLGRRFRSARWRRHAGSSRPHAHVGFVAAQGQLGRVPRFSVARGPTTLPSRAGKHSFNYVWVILGTASAATDAAHGTRTIGGWTLTRGRAVRALRGHAFPQRAEARSGSDQKRQVCKYVCLLRREAPRAKAWRSGNSEHGLPGEPPGVSKERTSLAVASRTVSWSGNPRSPARARCRWDQPSTTPIIDKFRYFWAQSRP
jgi:hypothetical protein